MLMQFLHVAFLHQDIQWGEHQNNEPALQRTGLKMHTFPSDLTISSELYIFEAIGTDISAALGP